jgi:hypothetical protein
MSYFEIVIYIYNFSYYINAIFKVKWNMNVTDANQDHWPNQVNHKVKQCILHVFVCVCVCVCVIDW